MEWLMVNYLRVFLATILCFIIGFIWYGPLFGKAWMKLIKIPQKELKKPTGSEMIGKMIVNFISTGVMVFVFAALINMLQINRLFDGIILSFLIWIGFFATTNLGVVLWENKSINLYFLNSVYSLIILIAIALVILI